MKTKIGRRDFVRAGLASGAGLTLLPALGGMRFALAEAKPIKIGVLAPLSGVYSSLGTNKVNGIKMFFGEQGMKIAGRPVQLMIEDTEAMPQEGLRKARKLVEEDEVDVLLGVISSAIGYPLKQYVARARKVWVTTGAAADGIFKKKNNTPFAYRASLSTWQANNPMGSWLGDQGIKSVFLTGPDYAMGREALEAFSGPVTVKGAKVVGGVYPPLGTNDFAAYLAEIKKSGAALVYASYAGSDAVRFVQQFAAFGLRDSMKLAGYGYLVSEDLLAAQGDTASGIQSGLNWAYGLDTPANKSFVANYRRRYANAVPTVDSVAGYVGAAVVFDAMQRLDGKVSDQEALSDAILKTKIDTPRGPVSFDPTTRNVIQNIYVREVVKDGAEYHNSKILATYKNVVDPGV